MKSFKKLLWAAFFLAVFGFVFWGCDDGGGGNTELPELTGTVSISGTAEVGQTLTAVTSTLGGSGTISYQWKHGVTNIGTNSSTYTIKLEDAGGAITVTVTRSGNTGSVTSLPTDPIATPGLQFTLLSGGNAYSVSKGTATAAVITIPAIHEGKPVTTIADNGFLGYTNLTSIVLPNGITRIGSYAFYQCENLVSVVIPTVVVIGNFAFDGCSSLVTVFYRGASGLDWATTMLSGQGLNNAPLMNAKIYYYSAEDPLTVDSHWYLYDGHPFIWFNCSVAFNSNGGSAVTTQIVYYGYSATRPANPTRSGFVFDNWYSDAGLTIWFDWWSPITTNITLYAKWLEPITVSFNSNGGSTVTAQTIGLGRTAIRPTNPTRIGYTLENWYSDVGLTTVYNFSTSVTSNITLYAKWRAWNTYVDGIEMVWIYTGTFIRGSSNSADWNASPPHDVMLTNPFYMGKYEVTQEQYLAVMGVNPSWFNSNPATGETQARRPVEGVTWFDAIEFCNKLSEIEGLTPVYTITGRSPATGYPITSATVTANWNSNGYRLPTEAEWEYACRAGTTTAWHFGNTESQLVNYAWYTQNSNNRTHEVGLKLPNVWGLYDMHGNVYEWCWDWYASYSSGAQTDPRGPDGGTNRVNRGGCWFHSAESARSAVRNYFIPVNRDYWLGFRVVRN